MLAELKIRNFAIIDQLQAEFGPGLNALTGETGAGKSILVDAINLLLGGRASPELIRTGQEEAVVEACFDLTAEESQNLLTCLGQNGEETLLIRRLIHRSGKSRALINGEWVTLHMLQQIGDDLINIYGQHEHQHFLDPGRHIDILDRSADLLPLRRSFQEIHSQWLQVKNELEECTAREKQRADRLELVNFQLREITRANLRPPPASGPDEEGELMGERARLLQAEKLQAIAHQGAEILYGESGSIVEHLKVILQRLREGAKIDPLLLPSTETVEGVLFQAEDVASFLRSYRDRVHFDPRRLEEMDSRLDEINRLKRKYGATVQEVLAYQEKIHQERQSLESLEERITDLKNGAADLYGRALSFARDLSQKRTEAARELSRKVEAELSTLSMKKARFSIQVDGQNYGGENDSGPALHEKGVDRVQFLLSPNPGEDLKPLAKIASGGELSRIMLALKRIFARETLVKTLIFDEVDAGIGGAIAEIVGQKLKVISKNHQVFCITHLPQIAAFADAHYRISKKVQGGRTWVEIKHLSQEERLEEIARMLGGVKITDKTLDHAREMLQSSSSTKAL